MIYLFIFIILFIILYFAVSEPKRVGPSVFTGYATFIGSDGSMGLKNGEEYLINIKFTYNMKWDYELSVMDMGICCPYISKEAIKRNWVLDGNSSF